MVENEAGETVKGQMLWIRAMVMTLDLSLIAVRICNSQLLLGFAAVTNLSNL